MGKKKDDLASSPNHDLYAAMSRPFETIAEAESAILAFFKDLGEIREKHRIANVYVVVKDSAKEVGPVQTRLTYGSELEYETMVAWAFGCEQAERKNRIARILEHARSEAP